MPRDLNDSVLLWSTPAAQDAKNTTLPPSQEMRDTLPGDLLKGGTQGQLNPDWVETLMGYPIGWTALPSDWMPRNGRRAEGKRNTTGSRPKPQKACRTARRASE